MIIGIFFFLSFDHINLDEMAVQWRVDPVCALRYVKWVINQWQMLRSRPRTNNFFSSQPSSQSWIIITRIIPNLLRVSYENPFLQLPIIPNPWPLANNQLTIKQPSFAK